MIAKLEDGRTVELGILREIPPVRLPGYAVLPAAASTSTPAEAVNRIDGRGRQLLPGALPGALELIADAGDLLAELEDSGAVSDERLLQRSKLLVWRLSDFIRENG